LLASESGAGDHHLSKLRDSDPVLRNWIEDTGQDFVHIIRDGEDSLEEILGAGVGPISRILVRGLLPWVASTSQVDEDDAEAPDIVGSAHVVGLPG
jgi:hypothetical protein